MCIPMLIPLYLTLNVIFTGNDLGIYAEWNSYNTTGAYISSIPMWATITIATVFVAATLRFFQLYCQKRGSDD